MMMSSNTNQYKDLIAQREFSGPEVRSLIAPALMTFTTSDLHGWRKCLKYVGNIQDHVVCNE
jgi:hypothetical protein